MTLLKTIKMGTNSFRIHFAPINVKDSERDCEISLMTWFDWNIFKSVDIYTRRFAIHLTMLILVDESGDREIMYIHLLRFLTFNVKYEYEM